MQNNQLQFQALDGVWGDTGLPQVAYNELLNMDEEFMGAYMQGLLSDQGAGVTSAGSLPVRTVFT